MINAGEYPSCSTPMFIVSTPCSLPGRRENYMGSQGQMRLEIRDESGVNEGMVISHRFLGVKATEPRSAWVAKPH